MFSIGLSSINDSCFSQFLLWWLRTADFQLQYSLHRMFPVDILCKQELPILPIHPFIYILPVWTYGFQFFSSVLIVLNCWDPVLLRLFHVWPVEAPSSWCVLLMHSCHWGCLYFLPQQKRAYYVFFSPVLLRYNWQHCISVRCVYMLFCTFAFLLSIWKWLYVSSCRMSSSFFYSPRCSIVWRYQSLFG